MSSITYPCADIDRSAPSRLIGMLSLWRRRHCTRRHLRGLDLRLLADVGIAPLARRREIAKWFWQA